MRKLLFWISAFASLTMSQIAIAETVKIGFKHIAGKMIHENILLGGEESGGIAINSHLPERDGIWMGLTLFEFMAMSGITIEQLIDEIYNIVGEFAFERIDLQLDNKVTLSLFNEKILKKFPNSNIIISKDHNISL